MPPFAIALVLLSAIIHASWNLLAHSQKVSGIVFLRLSLITGLVGLPAVLLTEWRGNGFPPQVWGLQVASGLVEALYYLGLLMAYRSANFSVVYPIARALPILFLTGVDILQGQRPAPLGWVGLLLVMVGCFLAPLQSLEKIHWSDYWNPSTVWILLITFSTVGYTTVDNLAVDLLPTGAGTTAHYIVWESLLTVPFLWIALAIIGEFNPPAGLADDQGEIQGHLTTAVAISPANTLEHLRGWLWSAVYALFVTSSHWLMVWSYQLSAYTSYLAALRQFSIVLGVVFAVAVFREPAAFLRITAALLILAGMLCIGSAA